MILKNEKQGNAEKDYKAISSTFIDKIMNECLFKYNRFSLGKTSNDIVKRTLTAKLHSISSKSKTEVGNTSHMGRKRSNDKPKTHMLFLRQKKRQYPLNENRSRDNNYKALTQTKEVKLSNKSIAVKDKSNKFIQAKQCVINDEIVQTEPNKSKRKFHCFLQTFYSSTNSKRQFSSTSTSYFRQMPKCLSSTPYFNPNLISFYSQSKAKHDPFYVTERSLKGFNGMKRHNHHTTPNEKSKAYNSTTDFKHMRFHNKFFNLNKRVKSSAIRNFHRNNYLDDEFNGSGANDYGENSNELFYTLPKNYSQRDDSSYNKFMLLTSNRNSLKQNLIYRFIRQREERLKMATR